MSTCVTKTSLATNKGNTIFLFMLAILTLVISCPVKRLLQQENNVNASAKQPVKWKGAERQVSAYKSVSCNTQEQSGKFTETVVSKQQTQSPDQIAVNNLETGFAIHYFINGTGKRFSNSLSDHATFHPLFLRHRRLLI